MYAETNALLHSLAVLSMCSSKMTKQLLTCSRMLGIKLHSCMRRHTHTHARARAHYNQSHSLAGWAWQLEICGSQDHFETYWLAVCTNMRVLVFQALWVTAGCICKRAAVAPFLTSVCVRFFGTWIWVVESLHFTASDSKQVNFCLQGGSQMNENKAGERRGDGADKFA